jgi:hypothetical protein
MLGFLLSSPVQLVLNYAHENTDSFCCANQSLNGIGCVFKVNTGDFQVLMYLIVVCNTQRCSNPCQVVSTADVMLLALRAVTAHDACRFHRSAGDFHVSPPTE